MLFLNKNIGVNQEMYNYIDKVYILYVFGKILIENKYKNYVLVDDKVFNGSVL